MYFPVGDILANSPLVRGSISGLGNSFQVMKSPVPDATGKTVGVQVIFWDVTKRRKAEAALEQERYLLHALMDSLPHNIYFKQ